MQRDLNPPVRYDTNEEDVARSRQASIDWSWENNIAIPPDVPRDETPEDAGMDDVSTPYHQQQLQTDIGDGKISLDQLLALRDAAEHFHENYDKLKPVRMLAMEQRSSNLYEMDQYSHRRRLYGESQHEYLEHFQGYKSSQRLDALRFQVEADRAALDRQHELLLASVPELSQTEYYMQTKEEELLDACEGLLKVLRGIGIPSPEHATLDVMSPTVRSPAISLRPISPEIDPLIEDYREKVGAISWRHERVDDAQREYLEARNTRIFRQDHDQDVEGDDKDFEEKYRLVISNAEAAVQTAVVDAEEARQACVDASLDPDAGRNLAVNDLIDLSGDPVTPGPQSTYFAADILNVPDVLSGGGKSSALLSTLTGNLPAEIPLQRQQAEADTENKEVLVEEWMNTSISEDIPFDDRFFEDNPKPRPMHYARKSEHDLRRLSIDPQMIKMMPQHIRERLDPRSSMQQSEGASILRLRRQRSFPDIMAATREKRQDSGYGSLEGKAEEVWPG